MASDQPSDAAAAARQTGSGRTGLGPSVFLMGMAALGILLVALTVARAWQDGTRSVEARTLGYRVQDDTHAEVTFEVRSGGADRLTCEARARSADGSTVGSVEVVLAGRRQVLTVMVPTRRRATVLEVARCRAG